MAEQLGEEVTVHGRRLHAFPAPGRLATLETFPGLFGRKAESLRALAGAAAEGCLDARRLRALPREEAMHDLRSLPGIGDFSAELVLLRGAGDPDHVPTSERRLLRAVAHAYGLDHDPSPRQVQEIADAWRPYRTWVAVLLRTQLEDDTAGTGPARSSA